MSVARGRKVLYRRFQRACLDIRPRGGIFPEDGRLDQSCASSRRGGTPFRTIRETTAQEGILLQEHLAHQTRLIFQAHGLTQEGAPQAVISDAGSPTPPLLAKEAVKESVGALDLPEEWRADILTNPVPYEDTQRAVNISIDDVGAKKQKASREKPASAPPSQKKRVYVQNTVIHVEKGGRSYILNGYGVGCVLRILLAFLLHNQLLSNRWIFFCGWSSYAIGAPNSAKIPSSKAWAT